MSEKRFKRGMNLSCVDTETGESYWYACNLCSLLNEMSERINEQQSFIGRELLRFDKYLAERLNEKEEIIKEQETIINQLDQKIKDKNEYQQVLESKIRRLKDRIKVLEK